MARNTIVTNVTRQSMNLYPYQGLLEPGESVVIAETPEAFLSSFGGVDGSVAKSLSISSTGDAATVETASVIDVALITNVDHVVTGYAYTQNILADSTGGPVTVDMDTTGLAGAEVPEGVIYTVKDVGGGASASGKEITVQHSGGFTFDGALTYVIDTDYASVGFYREGSTFIPLPGVSSGGGATELLVQKFAYASGPIAMGAANVPDVVLIDTLTYTAAITLKMPPIATTTKIVRVADESDSAGTYNVTIEAALGDSSARFGGPNGTTTLTLSANGQSYSLVPYSGHWYIT